MNNNLKHELALQRKWREQKISVPKPKRWRIVLAVATVVIAIIFAMIACEEFLRTGFHGTATGISAEAGHEFTPNPFSAASSTPATISMIVCAGTLHVRYTPNGSVRGYLKEGEVVTLKTDAQGRPVTQNIGNEYWILASTPVEGWINKNFLCK